ncbi:MAG: hypothetical protein WDZ31_00510 [Phycisphaeraceae bacterium]
MPDPTLEHDATPWHAWRDAVARPTVDAAVRELYARLDADVARRGPTCWVSGRCCNFDAFDHRLYVTGLEIAWFLKEISGAASCVSSSPSQATTGLSLPQFHPRPEPRAPNPDLPASCRYQVDGKCSTHTVRPLGCRIFFCQAGTEQWQGELYETYLDQLRALHERESLPYRYLEWRAGLIEADAAIGG